jgi:hypothetical protein
MPMLGCDPILRGRSRLEASNIFDLGARTERPKLPIVICDPLRLEDDEIG